jgi:hypothetical protein
MPELRPYMTDAAADALIASVLDRLFEVESGLPPDVSERTVAGLLGRHFEHALRESPAAGGGWCVDVEYNRLGLDSKRLPELHEMLVGLAARLSWPADDFATSADGLVVPDIIVHRRQSGVGRGNFIVCEVKRIAASKRAIAADLVKLAGYRQYIGYEHAFLILLGDTRDACVAHRASTSLDEIAWYVQHLDEAAGHPAMEAGPREVSAASTQPSGGRGCPAGTGCRRVAVGVERARRHGHVAGAARRDQRARNSTSEAPLGASATSCKASPAEVSCESSKRSRPS